MGRRWLSPTNDNYSCWWTTTSIVGRQPRRPIAPSQSFRITPEADRIVGAYLQNNPESNEGQIYV
jgi:hypothetical protein